MSATIVEYVQPIAQPLDGLQGQFTQLAATHRDANARLHSQTDELVSSGTSETFQGEGARAYSSLVNYYLTTSEKHLQVLEDAAHNIKTNHATIMDATNSAASANLHDGLTTKVLAQVTHDQIIQQGSEPIWAVVNNLLSTLNDMKNTAGSFFGDLFHFHFSDALGDLGHEFSDVGQLVGDVTSLLEDIGRVLGQWASTVSNAVGRCLQFLGSAVVGLLDFVTGFSSMVNDIKTIFSGKASLLDKLLAAGDLAFNAVTDVLMLTGIGEEIRFGELAIKGAVEIARGFGRDAIERGVKDVVEQGIKDTVEQGAKDSIEQGAKDVTEQGAKDTIEQGAKDSTEQGTKDIADKGTGEDDPKVTYSRVQGGTPPNASRQRVFVNDDGTIRIPNKRSNLNVSVGTDHAYYFLSRRGANAEIVQFDLPKWLDDMIKDNAIEQYGYRDNPTNMGGTAPKIVDPTTPGRSYELPAPWIKWIEEYATGGRVIK